MLRLAALAALAAVAVAVGKKDHYDLDGDSIVGIDEFAVVSFAEQGLSKGEIGEIVKTADRNMNGILEAEELAVAKNALEKIANEKGGEWLKENDVNHDGRMSKDEYLKAVARKVGLGRKDISEMWRIADKNHDNVISYNEAATALYLIRSKSILVANKMLEKFDTDKNKRLSEDEAILMADVAFDVGTDEALDAFERVARNEEEIGSSLMEGLLETLRESAVDNIEERIREVDMDGDGVVSFNELRKRYRKKKSTLLKKLFRKCDVNRDDVLDGPEWVTLTTEVAMLKKRKTKHDKVIHVHPQTTEEYRGAAREEFGVRRLKRETEVEEKKEEKGEKVEEKEKEKEEEKNEEKVEEVKTEKVDEKKAELSKKEKTEDEEEVIKMSQWDGLLPIRDVSSELEIAEKDQVDATFHHFSDLVVEDDE